MLPAGFGFGVSPMSTFASAFLALLLAPWPALAEPMEAADPLLPCLNGAAPPADADQTDAPWGIEIASAFSKQDALDEFSQAKKDYSDILGDYSPTVLVVCNLSMGPDLRYSARIALDDRDAADKLCDKLQAAGGSCIVLKN
jgi:hypothetical protein